MTITVSPLLKTKFEPLGGYANFGFFLASWPAAPDTRKAAARIARMLVAMPCPVVSLFDDISEVPVFQATEVNLI